jgi:aquaporin Z
MTETQSWNKYVAELFGTFVLVFLGCAAILAVGTGAVVGAAGIAGVGYIAVALAFGLGLMAAIYAFGHVSGGHFNPAVTLAMVVSKRTTVKDAVPYVVCQVIGATLASGFLYAIWAANGTPNTVIQGAIAGTGTSAATGFTATGVILAELFMTMIFTWVILTATSKTSDPRWAGLVIGGTLIAIHLAAIGLTGASVNPARSTGPALLTMGAPGVTLSTNLWAYWVGPIVGSILGAIIYRVAVPEPVVNVTTKKSLETYA